MAFRTAAAFSLLSLTGADQCNVKHNTTYSNCWGDDLHGERADSFETCCQRCTEIPRCEVFTFDVWNASGHAEPYCFFKYGCSESRFSDTAVSGLLHRLSTEKTTKAPETTVVPTPATTEAPAGSTTTAGSGQPQCTALSPVAGVGLGNATKRLNVSSWEDCCGGCAAPTCSQVAFGRYSDAPEETWACFHFAGERVAAPFYGSGELMLRDDGAASCKDLGLEGCAASLVSQGPRPGSSTSPVALGAVGICTFLVTIPMGYALSRKLGLGSK